MKSPASTIPLLFLLSLCAIPFTARAQTTCPTGEEQIGSGWAVISDDCIAAVPGISQGTHLRSFTLNAEGQLMVFEAFGDTGQNSTDTGSRTYYFFPITRLPTLAKGTAGQIVVGSASVPTFTFGSDGKIAAITGAQFAEDPNISATNMGGVEVTYTSGILLDTGWVVGGQAIQQKDRSSIFRDPKGAACAIQNSLIFTYDSQYDIHVRFKSTQELSDFLNKTCPKLDLSSLSAASPSPTNIE